MAQLQIAPSLSGSSKHSINPSPKEVRGLPLTHGSRGNKGECQAKPFHLRLVHVAFFSVGDQSLSQDGAIHCADCSTDWHQ